MLSQQVVKIQRQQGLISQGNAVFDDLFELRLSIMDNPNQGIHTGDNKVTGETPCILIYLTLNIVFLCIYAVTLLMTGPCQA